MNRFFMRKNILLVNIVGETSNYLSATLGPLTVLGETLHPSSPDGPNLLPDKSILSYGARLGKGELYSQLRQVTNSQTDLRTLELF